MRLTSLGHAAVLVETGHERILFDPWLTQRLDRFWEHHPALPAPLVDEVLEGGVDHVVFSHHHFDHHHFPSLLRLGEDSEVDFDDSPHRTADITCIYPTGALPPRLTASGLGHQAIAWTLRRFGFEQLRPVRPGETVVLEGATLRTFPSAVPFPEMSVLVSTPEASVLLCGDSILHESTVQAFAQPDAPRVDALFLPAHSVSPPGVLTERRPVGDAEAVRARAQATFERYVQAIPAAVTIPSSFGWRVSAETGPEYDWCNHAMFPFTPVEARQRLQELQREGLLWGPGQVLQVGPGSVERVDGPVGPQAYDFEKVYAEVALDPQIEVPAFDPAVDRVGRQSRGAEDLLADLLQRLVATDFWYRALDAGAGGHVISLYEDDGEQTSFLLDPVAARITRCGSGPAREHLTGTESWTEIAASTLEALLHDELLYGSSFTLWASDSNLLSAVFHHPAHYTRHVQRFLKAAGR
ncbi:MBL fold metallo-hydrolase [Kineosporia babensis]|uniref:MBL fold metallo-hydrolase n=1 Tax=Kineosporia babensis TaxID=499548 RepID=A0A9X1NKB0_9ACTN|nr:MBL fold metallo-hydrolase [Kineosporia babensis]MCD5315728.1 MBL fold metallo-hydrolase [Kineosporia babensis]